MVRITHPANTGLGGFLGLNPFLVRASFEPTKHATDCWPHGLNPFLVRASFELLSPKTCVIILGRLNPFLVRASFEPLLTFLNDRNFKELREIFIDYFSTEKS